MFENRITVENREYLEQYLNGYDYRTSGLSFSALYMWRDINQFSWMQCGDYVLLSGVSHLELDEGIEEPFLFPVLTKTGQYDVEGLRAAVFEAKRIFEEAGHPFSMRLVPFHMLDIYKEAFPDEMKYIDDRPNYDYLYLRQSLVELKGKDLHPKRNHLNYFHKNFQYEYVELTSAMADDAMRFIADFNRRKEIPENEMQLLLMEEEAMADVFRNLEKVGYTAGAILIDGKIQALSIGGQLNKNTMTVHVEKANTEFRGMYQAINNEFCKNVPEYIKYMNREEDMGIANLRKAKLSYKPCELVEKYIIVFK